MCNTWYIGQGRLSLDQQQFFSIINKKNNTKEGGQKEKEQVIKKTSHSTNSPLEIKSNSIPLNEGDTDAQKDPK